MKKTNLFNRITLGVNRQPLNVIISAAISYGALWGILEPLPHFFATDILQGAFKYVIFIIVSIVIGFIRIIPKRRIIFKIFNTNTHVEIIFGNLFEQKGFKAIPVNEYFDSEIGDPVSPNSVHGIFIQQQLNGVSESFDIYVERALKNIQFEEVARNRGKSRRYELGTTAVITINDVRYFLFAFSKTNIQTLKAHTTVPQMWIALEGLWNSIRNNSGGTLVSLPLVGSGRAGVGLELQYLLSMLLFSLTDSVKKKDLNQTIRIVILDYNFDEIDLSAIKKLMG